MRQVIKAANCNIIESHRPRRPCLRTQVSTPANTHSLVIGDLFGSFFKFLYNFNSALYYLFLLKNVVHIKETCNNAPRRIITRYYNTYDISWFAVGEGSRQHVLKTA